MVRRDIFKRDGFWGNRSYKFHIYIFMIIIAVSAFLVTNYSGDNSTNVLQRVTGSGVADVPGLEPLLIDVEDKVPFLEKGEVYEIEDKTFMLTKIDKEYNLRSNYANGVYWIMGFTVTSDKPYVPEIRIISGKNVLAPEESVETLYGDKILRQVEGSASGLKVFDVPRDAKEIYLDFDINLNSSLYRLK